MKPHKIELQAFGPFAGSHSVDIEALARHGLFRISGPTGAGKTSILDAMVYALYGDAPGARHKHLELLRSDFADEGTETFVILEFSSRGDRYRVRRSPKQARPKARGAGSTLQEAKAELHRREAEGWAPIASGPNKVDPKVLELVGLDAEKFQQVVLLPQGEFEQVLRSSSSTRAKLLQSLFGTDRFERAVTFLKEIARTRSEAADAAAEQVQGTRSKAESNWNLVKQELQTEPAVQLREALEDDEEGTSFTQTPEALIERANLADECALALQKATSEAQVKRDEAKRVLDSAARMLDRFKKRQLLLVEQDDLTAQGSIDADLSVQLHRAEAARKMLDLVDAADTASELLDELLAAVEENRSDLLASLTAYDRSAKAPITSASTRALERKLDKEQNGLKIAIGQFEDALLYEEQATLAAASAGELEMSIEEFTLDIASSEEQLVVVTSELDIARQLTKRVGALEKAAGVADVYVSKIKMGMTLDQQLKTLGTRLEKAIRAQSKARSAMENHEVEYRLGIAAQMAALLVDGDPCPTCGSEHHPHPAKPAKNAVTDSELQASRDEYEALSQDVVKCEKEIHGLNGRRGELPEASLIDAAELALEEAIAESEHAAGVAETVPELMARKKQLEVSIKEARGELGVAQKNLGTEQASQKTNDETCKKLSREASKVSKDLPTAIARVGAIAKAYEFCEPYANGIDLANDARKESESAAKAFNRERELNSFIDADDVRTTAQTEEEVTTQREALDRRNTRRTEVAAELTAFAEDNFPDETPSVAELEETFKILDVSSKLIGARTTRAQDAASSLRKLAKTLGINLGAEATARASAEIAKTVHGVSAGHVEPRIGLENWILSTYLRIVLLHANEHLAAMTSGQYQLLVSTAAKGNAQVGLDLEVSDEFTGVNRPVGTLSGGETFLAALSLALGLAEVVAGHNSLVEALFIDEGFGSLDTIALERATSELQRLRDQGRIVGVISHVTEMKEAFPVGIEITKLASGSVLTAHYPEE